MANIYHSISLRSRFFLLLISAKRSLLFDETGRGCARLMKRRWRCVMIQFHILSFVYLSINSRLLSWFINFGKGNFIASHRVYLRVLTQQRFMRAWASRVRFRRTLKAKNSEKILMISQQCPCLTICFPVFISQIEIGNLLDNSSSATTLEQSFSVDFWCSISCSVRSWLLEWN